MLWMFLGCIAMVAIAALLFWYSLEENVVGAYVVGVFIACAAACLIVATFVTFTNWVSAGPRAELLNREFGTHYTADDIFYGDDIIKEVIYGHRSRIDLTTEQK